MLTRMQRLKIESVIAMCKTDEGVRIMTKLNDRREIDENPCPPEVFNDWIEYCKGRIEREGL